MHENNARSGNVAGGLAAATLALVLMGAPLPAFAQIAAMEASAKKVRQACRADAMRFCAGMRPGSGGIVTCLKSNEQSLSAGCGNVLPEAIALREQAAAQGALTD